MTRAILNYEQITKLLELFFIKNGYKQTPSSKIITNLTFNYGINYEDKQIPDNTFVIQKCSRVEDIKKAHSLCILPLFHIFACSIISMDDVIQSIQYLINTFNLDVSNIYLETSYTLEYMVKELQKKCKISNVKYIKENIALILNDGAGSSVLPYGSSIGRICAAMSICYVVDGDIRMEIAQLAEFINDSNINYTLGFGIERLYTAINFHVKDVFIPNWYNTLPLFKKEMENESQITGEPLPIGYGLILHTHPKDIINHV